MRKIFAGILILIIVLIFGTSGYMIISHSNFLDALYMTVITITTVGYGEVIPLSAGGKIFSMILILIGMGLVLYTISKITEAMVEGGIREILGRRNMEKKLAGLYDHYIVCGFGRIGKVICKELVQNNKKFVVIEKDPNELKALEEIGYTCLEGDGSNDDTLMKAHIDKAKGLIAVVSSDADNVYIILSARGLNPNLYILARSSGVEGAETKLLRAGASKVISPYYIGACRMAQLLVRPTVIDFIDLTVHAGELGLRLEELRVSDNSQLAHKSLMDSGIRKDHDLIVVAIKRNEGEMLFNPNQNTVIFTGDTLVVLGEHDNIKAFEKEL